MKKMETIGIIIYIIIIISLSFIYHSTLLSVITALTGIFCSLLAAKGKVSTYFWGVVNITLYGYLSLVSGYMGEMFISWFFLLPMNIIGWFEWKKHQNKAFDDVVEMLKLNLKQRLGYFILAIACLIPYFILLTYLPHTQIGISLHLKTNPLPLIDALTTVSTIFAMVLMVKRYVENWVLWIIVNSLGTILWLYQLIKGGSEITLFFMWIAYIIISLYGFYNWIQLEKKMVIKK